MNLKPYLNKKKKKKEMFVQSSGRGGVVVSNFGLCPNFIIFLLGVATEGKCLLKNSFFFVINIDFKYIFFISSSPLL